MKNSLNETDWIINPKNWNWFWDYGKWSLKYLRTSIGPWKLIKFWILSSSAKIVAGNEKKFATIISKFYSLKTSLKFSFHYFNGTSSLFPGVNSLF